MYGVVEIKGHQYRVSPGDLIDVQKMEEEVGQKLELNEVLFVGGDAPQIGTPVVKGASIKAQVIRQAKSRKVKMLKRRPRGWKKAMGHRQQYTCLLITELSDGNGNTLKIDSKSKNAEKYLK